MTRLINADELTMQIMCMAMDKAFVYGNDAIKRSKEIFALAMIAQAPTVDAEPVTRCKECKWWRENNDHTCKHFYTSPRVANDFCSYGEPKVARDDRKDIDEEIERAWKYAETD